MNPESLESYKLQVYNPGSPYPSPKSDPLKSFPKTSVDPENPLKLTIYTKRKRVKESDSEESEEVFSPSKKAKIMDADEMRKLFKEQKDELNSLRDDVTKQLADQQVKSSDRLESTLNLMQKQLSTIAQTQTNEAQKALENKEATDTRIKALEDRLDAMENASSARIDDSVIEDAVKNYVDNSSVSDSTWKANLAKDIFEHEHGLILHGIRLVGETDETKKTFICNFFRNELKASDDLIRKTKIKEVIRLGSDTGSGKPPPILVKLGHPTERNQLLPLSANLKQGVTMDKNIPKMYQKSHKEFKRLCWKLKLLHNVQAQVIFEGYKLILRYKKKDEGVTKFNWVVEKEFYPQPSDLQSSLSSSSTKDPNKHDTPMVDRISASKTIIVTGVPNEVTRDTVLTDFTNYFKDLDQANITDIQFKSKGTALIICKDWTACKQIASTYETVKMMDKEIFFILYNDSDPSSS